MSGEQSSIAESMPRKAEKAVVLSKVIGLCCEVSGGPLCLLKRAVLLGSGSDFERRMYVMCCLGSRATGVRLLVLRLRWARFGGRLGQSSSVSDGDKSSSKRGEAVCACVQYTHTANFKMEETHLRNPRLVP